MKELLLYRTQFMKDSIAGLLIVIDRDDKGRASVVFSCSTLELDYDNNKRNASSIPAGFYSMTFEYSNKFERNLWELKGVPNRAEIKIHTANYYRQLQGCIGIGKDLIDLDGDGQYDLTNSAETLEEFHCVMSPNYRSKIRVISV